jgi:dihydroorotate dehydrogenase
MYKELIKPLLFLMDAEQAHDWAIWIASKTNRSPLLQNIVSRLYGVAEAKPSKQIWGLHFKNPLGLAAGFDKNGTTPRAMQALGFGFVEVGSITAKSSAGNPKPRAFRLPEDHSLINRMGLNNQGATAIVKRLSKLQLEIPLGVNVAKTNDSTIEGDAAVEDYIESYLLAQQVADYITINISCPNTGEGKTFEDPGALRELLAGIKQRALQGEVPSNKGDRSYISTYAHIPTTVKFSVDTTHNDLMNLVTICEDNGIDGYVATNTSNSREGIKHPKKELSVIGRGGLSGRAIAKKSLEMTRWLSEELSRGKPVISVGGIDSVETALERLEAGAELLQVYTGLVFEGPGLVSDIVKAHARS